MYQMNKNYKLFFMNSQGFQNSSCCNGRMLGEFEYLNNGVSRQTFVLSQVSILITFI